ncbi:MAG: NAD(P)-dependent oxidoreductase [Actinobacteria bacterium]|nr:NAD(P)-dependent oxidoreductase [Actinomycetota bacterium]
MPETDRPVLVTGGAGFAGAYVVRELLDRDRRVVVYDLNEPRSESRHVVGPRLGEVVIERGSIDDWTRLLQVFAEHRPAAVVHLGAIMDTDLLDRNPMLALKVNVEGTCNVFEAARLFPLDRIVIFSSIAVHAGFTHEPIDGDQPTVMARKGPLGAYSAGKLAAEAFGYAYNQSFGLDVRIVRPSALYGFGMSWFAPNYVKQIVEPAVLGEPVRLRGGAAVPRDYANVIDLAGLVAAILEGPDDADRIFYAATGRPLRTGGDVGRIVAELIPGAAIELGDEWTDVDRAELAFRAPISIENARTQLGFEPRFAVLEDGLADYVARQREFLEAGGVPTPRPAISNAPGGS